MFKFPDSIIWSQWSTFNYWPQGEGNVFRSVCQSLCSQGKGSPSEQRLPWTETPQTETSLDRDPPGQRDPQTKTPRQGPPKQKPPDRHPPYRDPLHWDTPPWTLQRSVRILLECIFVFFFFFKMYWDRKPVLIAKIFSYLYLANPWSLQ